MVHFGWLIVIFVFGLLVGASFSALSKFAVDEIVQEEGGDEDNL